MTTLITEGLNYLDPNNTSPALTLSNANTTVFHIDHSWRSAIAESGLVQGKKYYWEVQVDGNTNHTMVGIASNSPIDTYVGSSVGSTGWQSGKTYHNRNSKSWVAYPDNGRIRVAYDPDAGKIWFGKNGHWYGDPAAGTGARYSGITGLQFPAVSSYGQSITIVFDEADFLYSIPEGFSVSTTKDTDIDGLVDGWENLYFGDLDQDGTTDYDGDYISNKKEHSLGTDPTDGISDMDSDTLPDHWEFLYFNGLHRNASGDFDNDGVINGDEYTSGTNPADIVPNALDPNNTGPTLVLSNDGTTASNSTYQWKSSVALGALHPGKKYYWEAQTSDDIHYAMVGIASDAPLANYTGSSTGSYGWQSGKTYHSGTGQTFHRYPTNRRMMIAYDPDEGKLWFGANGSWYGADPAVGEGARFSGITGLQYPVVSLYGRPITLIFDATQFMYEAPAGFTASGVQ